MALVRPTSLARRFLSPHRAAAAAAARWPACLPIASLSSGGGGGGGVTVEGSKPEQKKLVLYSKAGCCLCDALKEKLDAAIGAGAGAVAGEAASLASVKLEIRDIATNPEWERLYQYEIPVLARLLPDGSEEKLPRLQPRLGVELIQKKNLCGIGALGTTWSSLLPWKASYLLSELRRP